MVEGGSKVIGYFLTQSSQEERVVDLLVVTISPTLVGSLGTASFDFSKTTVSFYVYTLYLFNLKQRALPRGDPLILNRNQDNIEYEQFGPDIVMAIQY